MIEVQNFISGKNHSSQSPDRLDIIEPATGKIIGSLPNSNAEDVDHAVRTARQAFDGWSSTPSKERSRILMRISELISARIDELVSLESQDSGKPISTARSVDIPRAAKNFEFFAEYLENLSSKTFTGQGSFNEVIREPIGPVACISPWNLPLYLFTWKIAPALAAGNTVVAKPSEWTSLTASSLGAIVSDAGLPPGVLNIVFGDGVSCGTPLVSHPDIQAISFTGSTATGRKISELAAPNFKKISLEMGGKNPTILLDDAELDKAAEMAAKAAFSNQGQICLCGSRVLVHESIYEKVKEQLIEKGRSIRIGDPMEPETEFGALVSRPHFEKVLACIERAKAEGGKLLIGGDPVQLEGRCKSGYFIPPTVIEGLRADCETNQEEIFGPVCSLIPFQTEDEAVAIANSTRYGLSASIWSSNLERAKKLAGRIDAGIVWINTWMLRDLRTPFGGVKMSGLGREGGMEALRFFTEPKNICIPENQI